MIQRVVLVALRPAYKGDAAFEDIARQTVQTLRDARGVLDVRVGRPADPRTRAEWDLSILVQLRGPEDIEPYRTDGIHRAYADVFLRPMQQRIQVWNFEVPDPPGT